MAMKGSAKYQSVVQEDAIAKLFDGKRSKSSGAAEHDAGDVRCKYLLIECKVRMSAIVTKPLPQFIQQLEKVAEEAWESGKSPMLALRYYSPTSKLSGPDGWVDVTVRTAADDADREKSYAEVRSEESSTR